MTRLYIVEGLPCSGKSTTAKYISDLTGGLLFDENCGSHPADYEFSAFIPDNAAGFTPDERKALERVSEHSAGGIIVPLNRLEGELFNKALQYKIYDFLDWETERQVMLGKWHSFAQNAGNIIYVFNCVLLQNPMCETMMRFDLPPESSLAYITEICREIAPLEPAVVYLKSSRTAENVRAALPERGEEWLSSVIDYHCGDAYGKAHGLSGFNGYISALEERQRRELQILGGLPLRKLVIDEPQENWNAAYRRISDFVR